VFILSITFCAIMLYNSQLVWTAPS